MPTGVRFLQVYVGWAVGVLSRSEAGNWPLRRGKAVSSALLGQLGRTLTHHRAVSDHKTFKRLRQMDTVLLPGGLCGFQNNERIV